MSFATLPIMMVSLALCVMVMMHLLNAFMMGSVAKLMLLNILNLLNTVKKPMMAIITVITTLMLGRTFSS